MNLRTTPDALPWIVNEQTIKAFAAYDVLSDRELHARFDVVVEQYAVKLNIEAETAASMARTMILPAAVRHLALLKDAGVAAAATESRGPRRTSCGTRSRRSSRSTSPRTSPTRSRSSGPATCATR